MEASGMLSWPQCCCLTDPSGVPTGQDLESSLLLGVFEGLQGCWVLLEGSFLDSAQAEVTLEERVIKPCWSPHSKAPCGWGRGGPTLWHQVPGQ